MADEEGFIDTDKLAVFTPTMELRYEQRTVMVEIAVFWKGKEPSTGTYLQQKWTNELGESEWRDIPIVISE